MSIVTILIAYRTYTCLVCMISIIFLNIFYAIFAGDAAYIYRKIIIYVVYVSSNNLRINVYTSSHTYSYAICL